ncbi:hypothetical protein PG984_005824 [Apiospora sp. TS-2023a]
MASTSVAAVPRDKITTSTAEYTHSFLEGLRKLSDPVEEIGLVVITPAIENVKQADQHLDCRSRPASPACNKRDDVDDAKIAYPFLVEMEENSRNMVDLDMKPSPESVHGSSEPGSPAEYVSPICSVRGASEYESPVPYLWPVTGP